MLSPSNNRFKLTSPIMLVIIEVYLFIKSASVIIMYVYNIAQQHSFDILLFSITDVFQIEFIIIIALFVISGISLIMPKQIVLNESAFIIRNFPRSKKLNWFDIDEIIFQESDMSILGKMTWRGYYSANNLITVVSSNGTYFANLKDSKDIPRIIEIIDNFGIAHSEKK